MLSLGEIVIFVLMVGISGFTAYLNFTKMFAVIQRGQGSLNFDNLFERVQKGFFALVSQGEIIRHRTLSSVFHYFIAIGFLYYFLVNVVDVLEGLIPGFHIPDPVGGVYRFLADILTVFILMGMTYFLARRFIFKPEYLHVRDNVLLHPKAKTGVANDSAIVGLFIWTHVGARFLSATFLVALAGGDAWQPFAGSVATLLSSWSVAELTVGWHLSWWTAIGFIFIFLPYFPYTKHAHLFMGPFNYMTRPERPGIRTQDAIDFEDEELEQFGVVNLLDLHQTQLVDPFACIMCKRCQEVCPAYNSGSELSPAALEINKRYLIWDNFDDLAAGKDVEIRLLDNAISESAVWACTSCAACIDVCPVGNEPMLDILDIRRSIVLMEEGEFPGDLKGAFDGMERTGNPWQMAEDRMAWAAPLDFEVPTVEDNPEYEVLYWVGCAGAFDPTAQEIARATATLLHSSGTSFAVLGNDESCTGDVARRSGNEYLFYEMALGNIEMLNEIGANERTIVTNCPHCMQSIGKEYAQFGGHFKVVHHTQYITEMIGKGKLRLNGEKLENVTFHDPCYLGRHNEEFEAPRDALAKAGATLLEMDMSKTDSFCCGAGGAQMWKEDEHGVTKSVNNIRYEMAQETKAETLAVGCPFCARMMTDANANAGSPMEVKDVSQVVAEALVK